MNTPGPTTYRDTPGYELDVLVSQLGELVEQLQLKLGIGASTAAANQVLRGTGAGATAFGALQTADLAAASITQSLVVTTGVADNIGAGGFVNMAGMNTAITTVGGNLLCIAVGAFTNTVASVNSQVGFKLDTFADVSGPAVHSSPSVGVSVLWANVHLFTGVSAGAHTVYTRWLTGGGTLSGYGGRTLVVVELKR